eukprot:PhF_6_TR42105/c0_g1_i1/m.63570/K00327/POR; NADPH-ferrihemoprotein reductase
MDPTLLALLIAIPTLAVLYFMFFRGTSSSGPSVKTSEYSSPSKQSAPATTTSTPAGPRVTIIFGSQTGTAEIFAKTLSREASKNEIPHRLVDAVEYNYDDLENEKVVVFVAATYGEGEPTDSMKGFFEYLNSPEREGSDYTNVGFTVFGLGDSNYKYYNLIGKNLEKRMLELKSKRLYPLGLGDASKNLEEDFDGWKANMWSPIAQAFGITLKVESEEPTAPTMKIIFNDDPPAPLPFPKMASALEPTQKQPVYAKVISNKELLRNTTERSTKHVELDVTETAITYQSGDHAGVMPCNPDHVVDDYIRILGIPAENVDRVMLLVPLTSLAARTTLPQKVTVRTALKWYVDLCGYPKKSALRCFAHYCTDPREKEDFLSHLRISDESTAKYHKLQSKVRTVFGFLRKYQSCKVPLDHFFEMMPRIAPRYFSIASDQLKQGKTIYLTVGLVESGLCTQWLTSVQSGDLVPIFIRKSNFHLPMRAKDRPIIMVGAGTGVAPLIGFLHRRAAWKAKDQVLGNAMLFFGCRNLNEDYIYRDVVEGALAAGTLSTLCLAFSRNADEPKVYVQSRIRQHSDAVWQVLSSGGNVYVCGAKKMGHDVEEALLDVLKEKGGMNQAKAEEFLQKMEKTEKYLTDTW